MPSSIQRAMVAISVSLSRETPLHSWQLPSELTRSGGISRAAVFSFTFAAWSATSS
jgi:hypothetical protein